MIFFQKSYRFFWEWGNRLMSFIRILHLKIKYPSIKIDFNSYLAHDVEIIICDGAICNIVSTHFSKGTFVRAETGAFLKILNSYVGQGTMIVAFHHIEIHDHCSIGEYVVIRDQNHKYNVGELIRDSGYETGKIVLHKNVWLCAKSTVLKDVELGENTVVGAHSLVNKSFPANSLVVGIPAFRYKKNN